MFLSFLEMYINDIQQNTCDAKAQPEILKESPATAWVNGNNGLGAVVGNFCMKLAMDKAKTVGVGWVCARREYVYIKGFINCVSKTSRSLN